MFSEVYEDRLRAWRQIRERLEYSDNPFIEAMQVYTKAPVRNSKAVDKWNPKTWLGPWELIKENGYTETCILLGLCYTLQLTERFSKSGFEIHISTDNKSKETFMLLAVDDKILQPYAVRVYSRSEVPSNWVSQKIHQMPVLN